MRAQACPPSIRSALLPYQDESYADGVNRWITNIQSTISEEGLEVVDHARIEWRPEFQKGWNDNLLTVYEELAGNLPLAKDPPANFPMTREVYQGLFQQTAKECADGVWLYQPAWSVLAKKP